MEVKEYSQELQKLYLEFMMNDHELFVRVNNIVKPEYFDRPLRSTCLLYTSPSPRDATLSRMPSSA